MAINILIEWSNIIWRFIEKLQDIVTICFCPSLLKLQAEDEYFNNVVVSYFHQSTGYLAFAFCEVDKSYDKKKYVVNDP